MAEIKGGRGIGLWALVDYEDRGFVEGKSISLATGGYARYWQNSKLVELHREIMGFPEDKQVDHINGNRLDNRRSNLRLVTFNEQMQNKKPWAESGHRNVHKTVSGTYRVVVKSNGHVHYGGTFKPEDVALAVEAAVQLRARLLTHHVEPRSERPDE